MARKKKTEEQMKLFEEGGLKDEGGTVDPVSGNDVPPGSTQAEVRDDIPAQLSEGEFVFPADVVRYIGLENLMELRSKAKQGLAKMEAMGQMGNSEEATMDDDGEYEGQIDELIDNFDPNDPETMNFAEGGVVHAQQGTFVPGMPQQQFSYGYMPPQQQAGYQPPQVPATQSPDYGQFVSRPAQAAVGEQRGITEQRQYIGPNGEMITILFMDGKPQQEIPAGYKVYKPEEVKPEVKAPVVQQPDDGGGDGGGDSRESYDNYRSNMDKLSALDEKFGTGKFSEEWNNSVHKQKGFSLGMLNVGANIAADFARGVAADAVISEIAGKYELNPDDFKQTGFGRLQPGEYDVDKFLKGAAAARAPVTREETGLESGFIDENTYIDSEGNERDVTAKSAATKRGLAIEAAKPSVTPVGYDDSEDEASGRTSSGPSGPQGDPYDEQSGPSGPPGGSNASGDPSEEGSTGAGGDQASADAAGGSSMSSPFSKGGAVQQTQRALKSSRKKK